MCLVWKDEFEMEESNRIENQNDIKLINATKTNGQIKPQQNELQSEH